MFCYEDDPEEEDDASGCWECGDALMDDLSDFDERRCLACAYRAYIEHPERWGYRLRLLVFALLHLADPAPDPATITGSGLPL